MSTQRGTSLATALYGPKDRISILVDRQRWLRVYRVNWGAFGDIPAQGTSRATVTSIAAEADDDIFTKAAHGLITGEPVVFTHAGGFTGITSGNTYFVIRLSNSTFKLATTEALARAGTGINVTADGTGGTATSLFRFSEAEIDRLGSVGDVAEVTLIYETLPQDRFTENAVMEEVDVRRHPNYDAVNETERNEIERALDEKDAPSGLGSAATELYEKLRAGVTSYVVGSVEVTWSFHTVSQPSTVESLLGTISSPPGTASNRYLIVGGGVNQEGWYWVKTLVYRYSDKNWDSDLY